MKKSLLFFLMLNLFALPLRAEEFSDTETYRAVYEKLQTGYIKPQSASDSALMVLKALPAVDRKLRVADDEKRVSLYYDARVVRSFLKPENPEEEDPTESGDPEGEDPDGTETPGTETPVIPPVTIPPMAMAVPMDTSDPMYAQLEQFLTLIADRFQIYTVAVVELTDPTNPSDPSAWQPTVPEEAVEVSLAIPEGYDPSRTVVAEIGQSAGSQTPAWTEIIYQNINGSAVFKTDHSGLFVIAEEKQWKDIPASLEMTSKVDRLELTKVYPSGSRTSGALPASLKYSTAVPLTGDDYSVFIWGGITVLAAAAVIAGIIIIIKRRK